MGFNNFLKSLFGDKSTRDMKLIQPVVEKIKAAYPEIKALDNDALRASAAAQGIPLIEGVVHSSDVFYRQPSDAKPTYWERLRDEKGCLAVEMESFALFHNAKVLGKRAACLLTISDSFVSPELTTPEQRQTSFTAMMQVALGAPAYLEK